jgi:hypothetical protein
MAITPSEYMIEYEEAMKAIFIAKMEATIFDAIHRLWTEEGEKNIDNPPEAR